MERVINFSQKVERELQDYAAHMDQSVEHAVEGLVCVALVLRMVVEDPEGCHLNEHGWAAMSAARVALNRAFGEREDA